MASTTTSTQTSTVNGEREVVKVSEVTHSNDDENMLTTLVLMPSPSHFRAHDPFLALIEHPVLQKPGGFPTHPHRGFETITVVLSGQMTHKDSKGNSGVLNPGDVQWMTAGRGILHSEMPHGEEPCYCFQFWLNLPQKHKMTPAAYADMKNKDIPVFADEKAGVNVRVISGEFKSLKNTPAKFVQALLYEVRLKADATVSIDNIPSTYNTFIYVVAGKGKFGSANTIGTKEHLLHMPPLSGTRTMTQITATNVFDKKSVCASETKSTTTEKTSTGTKPWQRPAEEQEELHFLLFAGEPLREPIASRGPFVMSTDAELRQAFVDYHTGRFVE